MLAAARRGRGRALLTAIVAWSALAGALGGAEPTREEELAAVRERARTLEAQMDDLRAGRKGLERDLIEADLAVRLQEERAHEAGLSLDSAQAAVEEAAQGVRDLQQELGRARDELGARLGSLYRLGRQGLVRLALAARNEEAFLRDFRLVRYLARRDAARVSRYLELRGDLLAREEELERRRAEARLWAEREEARLAEVRELQRRKTVLLDELLAREKRVRAEAEELAERERRLSGFLAALAGESSLEGESMEGYAGVLERPVVGSVLQGFGPRLDPRYGTRVPHNGQEYVTVEGAPVHSIYPGTVLYAQELEGYGLTVVVHHPGRIFSLYAGLAGTEVAPGDVLSLGAFLGSSSGRLYFEIRVENRPVDPEGWLR